MENMFLLGKWSCQFCWNNRLSLEGVHIIKKIENITPGEILFEEFLKPLNITAYRLSKDTGMPATRISQILKGKRRITADTALRLSRYFGNSADFWMGIQDEYDLREEEEKLEDELSRIPKAVWVLNRQLRGDNV